MHNCAHSVPLFGLVDDIKVGWDEMSSNYLCFIFSIIYVGGFLLAQT